MELTKDDLKIIIKEVVGELGSDHDRLLTKQQVIDEYFGITYKGAIAALNSRDFPRTWLPGRKNPMYSAKAVEQWIKENTVFGYEKRK